MLNPKSLLAMAMLVAGCVSQPPPNYSQAAPPVPAPAYIPHTLPASDVEVVKATSPRL